MQGRTDALKERSIGVAVFERTPDYDTNQDPVVRNTAGQVRRRLAQYYMEPGHEEEVRIELPAGSYIAEIYRPSVATFVTAQVAPAHNEAKPFSKAPFIALAAVALTGIAAYVLWPRHTPTDLERFWEPMVKQPGPVVVCVGQGHTYKLGGGWDRKFEEAAAKGSPVPASQSVPVSEVYPAWDRYVGLNDLQTVLRLTSLFTTLNKEVECRGGRTTSLEDLRRKPVILVGAFNNEWTLNLTGELRFYFQADPKDNLDLVMDRQHPDRRGWAVRSDLSAAQIPMDYALISRVFNPTTEQVVVVAAGIKGGATNAAGEFLTNPDYLSQALRTAPQGWEKKNLQFVLSTRMFSGSPGPPTVIAAHSW